MSEDTPPEPTAGDAAESEKSPNWFYRIAASGVGAFVLAQEEIENRLKRLTGAGTGEALDDADEDAASAEPSEPSEESEEQEPVPQGKERRPIADYIDTTIANVLHSMSMPSHQDVEELSRKIDALSEKVERLRAS